jgi:hypothetical protein
MTMKYLGDLENVVRRIDEADASIATNRGYDRHLAREAHASIVHDDLVPALSNTFDCVFDDLETEELVVFGRSVLATLEKIKKARAKRSPKS